MTITEEKSLRVAVSEKARLMGFHVSNIESHSSSAGIPDINLAIGHVDIWLELKAFGVRWPMKIRSTQRKWHRERYEANGLSWFALLDLDHQEIFLVPGSGIQYVGSGLTRQWQGGAVKFKPEHIDLMIAYLYNEAVKRRIAYVTEQQRNSAGPSIDARSAGNSLPEGGQIVGGHHWLTDKP